MAQNKSPAAAALSMHKKSNTISKTKQKIRIVHIFAPEIIKTDASNFQELVQRLTGKPPPAGDQNPVNGAKNSGDTAATVISSTTTKKKKKIDVRETMKGEEEIWRGANSAGGGFLGGFDHDYFENELLSEMNVDVDDDDHHRFPYMEGESQISDDHVYGES